MKKNAPTKTKRVTLSQQLAQLVAETNRLVDDLRNEQRKNIKDLRKRLRRIETQVTPNEIASFKNKVIRYK